MPRTLSKEEVKDLLPDARWLYSNSALKIGRVWERTRRLKVKCECDCGRSWTSMRGILRVVINQHHGTYYFFGEMFSQRCQHCDGWTEPDYYDDEFEDVINYLIDKYLHPEPKVPFKIREQPSSSELGVPHDVNRCEACSLGFCREFSKSYVAPEPSVPAPAPPPPAQKVAVTVQPLENYWEQKMRQERQLQQEIRQESQPQQNIRQPPNHNNDEVSMLICFGIFVVLLILMYYGYR